MTDVIIDGIKYVPYDTIIPDTNRKLKQVLLELYWGDVSKYDDKKLDEHWEGLVITVRDKADTPHGITIQTLLENLTS